MRGFIFLTIAAFLFSGGMVFAADADPASQATAKTDTQPAPNAVPVAKIGVVDMQAIAIDSDAAKAFKEQMENKYGKERSALEKQAASVKKQAEALKNPKASEEKKVAFIKAKQKLDQDTRNLMRKAEQDEVKFRQDLVSLVFSAAYEVARARGFNFVVDVAAGGVLYADKSMDLTQYVMAEVNRLYKENKDKKPAEKKPAEKKNPADSKAGGKK